MYTLLNIKCWFNLLKVAIRETLCLGKVPYPYSTMGIAMLQCERQNYSTTL